jgi:hypothetical protein
MHLVIRETLPLELLQCADQPYGDLFARRVSVGLYFWLDKSERDAPTSVITVL